MDGSSDRYKIEKLNSLAFAKGQLPRCELTGGTATVACITPWLTLYYASAEQAEEAWHGIMHKIGPLLGPLRREAQVVGTEEDRARRAYAEEMTKKALIDLCKEEADKYILEEKYELAVPGALVGFNTVQDLYGEGSIESLEPLMQLAEASLGLKKNNSVETFLAKASWCIYKHPDHTSNALRSQLHRQQAKLFIVQNNLSDALTELARDVYCASLHYGPESIYTAPGYYYAASVFYAQHRIEEALAFYDKLVDIWFKFFSKARHTSIDTCQQSNDEDKTPRALSSQHLKSTTLDTEKTIVSPSRKEEKTSDLNTTSAFLTAIKSISRTQLALAAKMLSHVYATRAKLLGEQHIAAAEASYTLGLLFLFQNPDDPHCLATASQHLKQARDIYFQQLGPEHSSTIDIIQCLKHIDTRNSKFKDTIEPSTAKSTPSNASPDSSPEEPQNSISTPQPQISSVSPSRRNKTKGLSSNSRRSKDKNSRVSSRTNGTTSFSRITPMSPTDSISLALVGSSAPAKVRGSSAATSTSSTFAR